MSKIYILNSSTVKEISITGDKGIPSIKVPKTIGAAYTTIDVKDALGNILLCNSLNSLISSNEISVRWGSLTGKVLTTTEITGFKDGTLFDSDQDGKVDYDQTNIRLTFTGLNLKNSTNNFTGTLPGNGTKRFMLKSVYAICRTANTLSGDAHITIGTTSNGTEVLASTELTGLNAVNKIFPIYPTPSAYASILDNTVLYVKVSTQDSGTSGTIDVIVEGVLL